MQGQGGTYEVQKNNEKGYVHRDLCTANDDVTRK